MRLYVKVNSVTAFAALSHAVTAKREDLQQGIQRLPSLELDVWVGPGGLRACRLWGGTRYRVPCNSGDEDSTCIG